MRRVAKAGLAVLLFSLAIGSTITMRDWATAKTLPSRDSLTERNRQIVTDFAELFYVRRDVPQAFDTYVAPDYVQHNPGAADGRAAAVAMLTPMFSAPGARFYIKRIVVDGEMAVIHLHGVLVPGTRGVAVFDMYRLANGKIVEHWDAVQPVQEQAANSHPMF